MKNQSIGNYRPVSTHSPDLSTLMIRLTDKKSDLLSTMRQATCMFFILPHHRYQIKSRNLRITS